MGAIRTVVDSSRQVTVNTAEGVLDIDAVIAAVEHYLADNPTPKVLWDLRRADGSGIGAADLIRLQEVVRRLAPVGVRRKVALLVARDLGFGLSRMAEAQGEMAGIAADYYVTRSMEDALAWLGIPPS